MNRRDIMLALLVVTVWGTTFTVIRLGLDGISPMLLVAFRYTFTVIPAIFFIKPPKIEWLYTFAYGLSVGVGQFTCLFYAIHIGMPAGIASVVLQSKAFFALAFARVLLNEKLKTKQVIGLLIGGLGLYFIGGNIGTDGISLIPFKALLLVIMAAAFWAISNIIARYGANRLISQGEKLNMLSFVVWSSLVPPLPLLFFSLLLESPKALIHTVSNLNIVSVFAIFYLSFCATLFGYGAWSGLLAKYPVGKIAPISILVPVTGLITAYIVLGEQLLKMQWIGVMTVLLGIIIASFELTVFQTKTKETQEQQLMINRQE